MACWWQKKCSNFLKSMCKSTGDGSQCQCQFQFNSFWIWFSSFFFRNGKLNILSLYLDRYLRLTPLLCVCILISISSFEHFFGTGPIWPFMNEIVSGPCVQHWWSALLHIQNYKNPTELVSAGGYHRVKPKHILKPIFFLNFFSVFHAFMVNVCWYAILFHCTSFRLSNSTFQCKGSYCYTGLSFELYWINISWACYLWYSTCVCILNLFLFFDQISTNLLKFWTNLIHVC